MIKEFPGRCIKNFESLQTWDKEAIYLYLISVTVSSAVPIKRSRLIRRDRRCHIKTLFSLHSEIGVFEVCAYLFKIKAGEKIKAAEMTCTRQ